MVTRITADFIAECDGTQWKFRAVNERAREFARDESIRRIDHDVFVTAYRDELALIQRLADEGLFVRVL